MNGKGCGWKRPWPDFKYYRSICVKELRTTTKASVRMASLQEEILNSGPPKYEAEVLLTRPAGATCLLADFLNLFDPEDGGDMFLRNVG
jgi:hypothetical protein